MDESLPKLFGSVSRIKLLRLFLFNPNGSFTAREITQKARIPAKDVRRELAMFEQIGLVRGRRASMKQYALDPTFPLAAGLQSLLLTTSARPDDLYKRLKHVGNVRLIIVAGIFLGEWEASVDLFIVADRIREEELRKSIRILESELGRDLRFAVVSEQEFFYRLNMNDHLVRDVFDYPHRVVFDQLDIGLK